MERFVYRIILTGSTVEFWCKWTHETEWNLDVEYGAMDGRIPMEAILKIRSLMWNGTPFSFDPTH